MNDPTKETWQFDDPAIIIPGEAECGHSVARVYCFNPTTHEECVARGHLMAAAPELYRALDDLLSTERLPHSSMAYYVRREKAVADAVHALAKARGEKP